MNKNLCAVKEIERVRVVFAGKVGLHNAIDTVEICDAESPPTILACRFNKLTRIRGSLKKRIVGVGKPSVQN
jgi:hypothetical protein